MTDDLRTRMVDAFTTAMLHEATSTSTTSQPLTHRHLAEVALAVVQPEITQLTDRAEKAEARVAEWITAERHKAFTHCNQGVMHIPGWAFAEKISEKVEAVADARKANQRAQEAEAKLDHIRAYLPTLERAAYAIAATDPHRAITELTACIRAALNPPEETT